MNIAFVEDHEEALRKKELLEDYGHTVWHSFDFEDVLSWMVFEPGAESFGAFIFDLRVEDGVPDKVSIVNPDEPYDEDTHHSPSLYFIEKFLLEKYPHLQNRIILCSAYFPRFTEKGCNLDGYHLIDKFSHTIVGDLITIIMKLEQEQ